MHSRPLLKALCKCHLKLCPEKNCLAHFLSPFPIFHCPSTPTPLALPSSQPDDLQIQKVFWVHGSCPQTVAVKIEIPNLVHSSHPPEGRLTDLYIQKSHEIINLLDRSWKGTFQITFFLLKIAIKTCSFPSSPPKVIIHWSSTPENSNSLPWYRKFSTDNNIESFYELYYKSTAEIIWWSWWCSGFWLPLMLQDM